jgi:hypothetical protein
MALPIFKLHVPIAGGDSGAGPVRGEAAVHGQDGAALAAISEASPKMSGVR